MRCLLLLLLSLLLGLASANPMPVDQAFVVTASLSQSQLTVNFHVAPGYHLYKKRINFSSSTLTLGKPTLPAGRSWHDPSFGTVSVLENNFQVTVPIIKPKFQEAHIYLGYQGCADSGFCYPPIVKSVLVQLSPVGQQVVDITKANLAQAPTQAKLTTVMHADTIFARHSVAMTLLILFGVGLLLAFTPCVLPMIPILSSVVLGKQDTSTLKAFLLSVTYVLGMAITYAIAGVVMGLVGGSLQAGLQQPWVLFLFVLLFIILAMAMFGLFELQLPVVITKRLTSFNQKQSGGQFIGVAIMGVLSALVVSPCVSAPLVGVLAFIANTGNALLGGLALFVMALGMGLPLIVIGTLGGKFIPRSGGWMLRVKHICGFLLLFVSVYLLARLFTENISLILYGLLALSFAVYLWFSNRLAKILALLFVAYGIAAVVGGLQGHRDALQPWRYVEYQPLKFIHVKSVSDVQRALAHAKGKKVMLDFYADWCVSCKIMERTVFADATVRAKLRSYVLLQADVTANDKTDQILEKHYSVYGPPTILFFDGHGQLLVRKNLVGEVNTPTFLQHLS
jgi:thiol:disulfide interchange protein DsbD